MNEKEKKQQQPQKKKNQNPNSSFWEMMHFIFLLQKLFCPLKCVWATSYLRLQTIEHFVS